MARQQRRQDRLEGQGPIMPKKTGVKIFYQPVTLFMMLYAHLHKPD
jgi:hypothetical protein